MDYCREKGMSKNKGINSMKYKLKKLFINIFGSAVVTVADKVDFVFIYEDLGWFEVTVASVSSVDVEISIGSVGVETSSTGSVGEKTSVSVDTVSR
jgi:hypothetical protein